MVQCPDGKASSSVVINVPLNATSKNYNRGNNGKEKKGGRPRIMLLDDERGLQQVEREPDIVEYGGEWRHWTYTNMGGDLAPNLGGTKKCFRGPISGKISISRVKISDDLFFSHRPGSSDFFFLFPHFLYVYYVKCRIRKTQFFTLFMLSRTSDNTTSHNILGGPTHRRS